MTIQFGSTIRFGIRVSRSPELGGDVTYPLNPRFKPTHIEKLYDVLHTSQRDWGIDPDAGTVTLYLIDPGRCEHPAWRFSERDDYHGEECVVCGTESELPVSDSEDDHMNVRQAIIQQARFERDDPWKLVVLGAHEWAHELGISDAEFAEREFMRSALMLVWLNFGTPETTVQWPGITLADVEIRDTWGFSHTLRPEWTPKHYTRYVANMIEHVSIEDDGCWITDKDWLSVLSELVESSASQSQEPATVVLMRDSHGDKRLWLQLSEAGIQKLQQRGRIFAAVSSPSQNGSSPSHSD